MRELSKLDNYETKTFHTTLGKPSNHHRLPKQGKRRSPQCHQAMDGKRNPFPEESVFTIRGKDTIDFALNVSDYKIVSYIDTAGCTKVDYPKTPTPPGGTLKFTITYDADKPGYFNKSLKVYGNMEGSPIKLFVTGETH